MDLNPPKLSWNKLFCKLCFVDGLVLEYIEWKVNLIQVKIFDTIEMICVVEWFESCWHIILLTLFVYLSTLLFTQYILTLVHSLNTIYQIIYFNTVWVGWGPHTQFIPQMTILPCQKNYISNMIQTIQLHISFQLYQKYLLESTLLFTQCILTLVHPLNTIYKLIYFNTIWVGWGPHIQFIPSMTILPCQKNYVSKRFKLLNYICHFNCIKNIYLTQLYFSLNIF